MSFRPNHLAIDARPRGPRGLMAAEVVLGRSMLDHLLELAADLSPEGEPVLVHARPEEQRELSELAGERFRPGIVFLSGSPRADAVVLRTDRFYDEGRLGRRLRRGRSPESAVLWRLDRPEAIFTADEELTRRLTYQPVGKYWAFPLAERLAEFLRPSRVRPNAVTLASAALMLAAAGLIAFGPSGWAGRATTAMAMALALVLDTADGRLARLQGTSSAFGRWLDQFLDEMADLALHAAIAWSAFARDGRPAWLLLGIVYASGKYLFLVQSTLGDELERGSSLRGPDDPARRVRNRPHGIAALIHLVGHADIRWHLWIVLAAVGRLDFALAAYAAYFPVRTLAGAVRKGVRYA
jgi:phosphatidylglycerophosphate synthase